MSIPTRILESTPQDVTARSSAETRPGRQAAEQLGKEFEAILLLQMVRSMRQAMLDEQEADEGLGAGTMTDTFDVEFARQLGSTGAFGLAKTIADQISRQVGLNPGPAAGSPVGDTTPVEGSTLGEPVSSSIRIVPDTSSPSLIPTRPLDAPVTSPFGWRRDPLVGSVKFHRGIDLRAAYGREVPAAAAGRVIFAGEHGAYGQTVVVEHPGGYQTRYAHLSAIGVEAGQELATGTIVGRVGQTGRATGPHLHFEVSRDGRHVDPEELAHATS